MGHLSIETLARLVDDAPDPAEARHLESCAECARELAFLQRQTRALGDLPALRPPADDWGSLEARLEAQGLLGPVAGGEPGGPPPARRGAGGPGGLEIRQAAPAPRGPAGQPFWIQVAAVLVLSLGGSVLGAGFYRGLTTPSPGGAVGTATGLEARVASVTTLDEAAEAVRQAEQDYIQALVRYRQFADAAGDREDPGIDPSTRFAALDAMTAAGRAALREAPTDPFLNSVFASLVAERQAYAETLSQTDEEENWY